ncbi:MAG: homoserine kinase [Acidimicrobiia bacterium]|nr:homoserine kinase [Acidimicrobiia bacterium]
MTTGSASAPASSANLGPGFDCLGLALELHCHVEATPNDEWLVEELGTSFVPKPTDFVRLAVEHAVGRPMRLTIRNEVPRSRGLGSSSAVMVACAAAALRAGGEEPDSASLYDLVMSIEGHGDNAGAAVYGGLIAVAEGVLRHLELSPDLTFVFGVPNEPLKTAKARMALPAEMSRRAAARNVARIAFLVEGLRTGDPEALAKAGGDEIHEQHRAELSPITGAMMQAARDAGALHAAWSGAGPTTMAIAKDPEPVVAALKATLGDDGEAKVLDVAHSGWS